MKKFILCGVLSLGALVFGNLTAFADYYSLEFKSSDGSSVMVATEGLVITVDGDNLIVSNSKGEALSLPAASLVSMQFVDDSGAVESIFKDNGELKVYNLEGVDFGTYNSLNDAKTNLSPGIYVIRNSAGETVKIIVNK